ncbi:DUF1194 domain-containing protein [Phyllobacterium zundukense]|uniref:DUF1194 domain-containing protein n=1 Tax=Phyllobacterium zundukense TaxID=1867719 RepID=UPI003AAC4047
MCAGMSIVDISGDGLETLGSKRHHVVSLYYARKRAEQMGVTVNALVISDDGGDLARYYSKKVTIGSNSFVMNIKK